MPAVDAPSLASTTWVAISFQSTKTPSMIVTLRLRLPSVPAPGRRSAPARAKPNVSGATAAGAAGSRASAPATDATARTSRKSVRRRYSSICPPLFCTSAPCRLVPVVDSLFLRTSLCCVDTIKPHCRRVWRIHRHRHSPYVNIRAPIRPVLLLVRTQRRSWSVQCRRSFSSLSNPLPHNSFSLVSDSPCKH